MNFAYRYISQENFSSYEDFCENFKIIVPKNFNFAYDIVDAYARLEPERKALVWCDDHGNERVFTFTDLKKYSDKTANMLKDAGICKGDRVMLILRRRYEVYFAILALAKIGAIYIPSSNQLTEKDIVYRNNAAGVKAIIAYKEPNLLSQIESAMPQSPSVEKLFLIDGKRDGWEDFDDLMVKSSDVWVRPSGNEATLNEDTMIIYFTSGTTSMPKMAVQNFTYPLGHIVTAKYWQRVIDGGLHLTVSDSGWAKFGWGKIYGQWICGAVQFVYDMDKFVPETLMEKMERYKLATFCAPPTIYRFLLDNQPERFDLSSIKYASTAGEPLNPDVFNRFRSLTGLRILNGFGQSETTVLVANFEWLDIYPGAMGKPNPAYKIDVVDEQGCSCPPGEEGEIVIREADSNKPVGLFCGYYQDKVTTAKVWYEDTYHTGDMAYWDEHGFLWFVGRNDDVIKASGYRISPFEVESVLIEHPAVLECAVTGAPDPIRGTVVKATVVLAKGYVASAELKKEIQDYVKKVTSPYKYPRILEFTEELPKTIGGKIKRAQIRQMDNQR
ncbi:MAG: Acetyl-coenzyme A synthetase [Candidatus Dichloromethanomonas elyunquensis]|nr:MAG: Acetyl-coenzyme A synthetase [Candidatus Dichloromethanomonas elyunquensis]